MKAEETLKKHHEKYGWIFNAIDEMRYVMETSTHNRNWSLVTKTWGSKIWIPGRLWTFGRWIHPTGWLYPHSRCWPGDSCDSCSSWYSYNKQFFNSRTLINTLCTLCRTTLTPPSGQTSAWELCPVYSYTALTMESCDTLCVLTISVCTHRVSHRRYQTMVCRIWMQAMQPSSGMTWKGRNDFPLPDFGIAGHFVDGIVDVHSVLDYSAILKHLDLLGHTSNGEVVTVAIKLDTEREVRTVRDGEGADQDYTEEYTLLTKS